MYADLRSYSLVSIPSTVILILFFFWFFYLLCFYNKIYFLLFLTFSLYYATYSVERFLYSRLMLGVGRCRAIYNSYSVTIYVIQIRDRGINQPGLLQCAARSSGHVLCTLTSRPWHLILHVLGICHHETIVRQLRRISCLRLRQVDLWPSTFWPQNGIATSKLSKDIKSELDSTFHFSVTSPNGTDGRKKASWEKAA